MSKLRTLLTATALVLLTAVSLAAAMRAYVLGIPESLNPDRSPLVNLLSSRDVAEQPIRAQRNIIQQLENELRRGTEWLAEVEDLDDEQRATFKNNVAELARVAFVDKAEAYSRLPDPRSRERFLDRQIEVALGWAAVFTNDPGLAQKTGIGPGFADVIVAKIGQQILRADSQQRKQIAIFEAALFDRFSKRKMRSMRETPGWQ